MSEQSEGIPLAERGARALGLQLTPWQVGQLSGLVRELLNWNQRVNLTSITGRDDVQVKHLVDSLSVVPVLRRLGTERGTLIEVGSGAGCPGLVLAIAFPQLSVTLVEATGKKVQFLQHAVRALAIVNASVAGGRAEELAQSADYRERYDVAVARAVGSISTLVELLMPFLRIGGHAVLMKTLRVARTELERAERAVAALSCVVEEVVPVVLPGLLDDRALIVVRKTGATGQLYPRRPGIPQRRPL